MLDRLCNEDSPPNDSIDEVVAGDDADEEAVGRERRLSRTQSCASLVTGEEDEATATTLASPGLKTRWSRSSPSLLSKGEIEQLALEAAQSQDLGFLRSSVETLKEQLGR